MRNKRMLTDAEYRLLCRIRDEGDAFDPTKLSGEEKNTLGFLLDKGYVSRQVYRSGQVEKQFHEGEEVLRQQTGGKADDAEKHIEPELSPRAHGIFTPTFLSGLLLSGLLGFVAGAVCRLLLEHIFML